MQHQYTKRSLPRLVVSVHIPKTAGTSLIYEIKRGVFGRYIFDSGDRPASPKLRYKLRRLVSHLQARMRRQELLRECGIVHGHFHVSKYAFLYPDADFLTFMREPVARALSQYYYFKHVASKNPTAVKKNPDIMLVAQGSMDIVEFVRLDSVVHMYERFTDGLALENFALIGITERYSESIGILNRMFGTEVQPKHEHRSDYTQYASEYEHLFSELGAASRQNTHLYEAALKLFEQRLRTE